MKRLLLCLCVLGILLPTVAMAEFYKYRDASGVMRFTDNLAEVPKDQRPQVTSYSEPDDLLTPEEREKKAQAEAAATAAKAKPASAFDEEHQERLRLNKLRMDLDTEYGDLMKEKESLDTQKAAAKSDADRKAYRDSLISLNKRITAYESKRIEYEAALEKFNQGAPVK